MKINNHYDKANMDSIQLFKDYFIIMINFNEILGVTRITYFINK